MRFIPDRKLFDCEQKFLRENLQFRRPETMHIFVNEGLLITPPVREPDQNMYNKQESQKKVSLRGQILVEFLEQAIFEWAFEFFCYPRQRIYISGIQ